MFSLIKKSCPLCKKTLLQDEEGDWVCEKPHYWAFLAEGSIVDTYIRGDFVIKASDSDKNLAPYYIAQNRYHDKDLVLPHSKISLSKIKTILKELDTNNNLFNKRLYYFPAAPAKCKICCGKLRCEGEELVCSEGHYSFNPNGYGRREIYTNNGVKYVIIYHYDSDYIFNAIILNNKKVWDDHLVTHRSLQDILNDLERYNKLATLS